MPTADSQLAHELISRDPPAPAATLPASEQMHLTVHMQGFICMQSTLSGQRFSSPCADGRRPAQPAHTAAGLCTAVAAQGSLLLLCVVAVVSVLVEWEATPLPDAGIAPVSAAPPAPVMPCRQVGGQAKLDGLGPQD